MINANTMRVCWQVAWVAWPVQGAPLGNCATLMFKTCALARSWWNWPLPLTSPPVMCTTLCGNGTSSLTPLSLYVARVLTVICFVRCGDCTWVPTRRSPNAAHACIRRSLNAAHFLLVVRFIQAVRRLRCCHRAQPNRTVRDMPQTYRRHHRGNPQVRSPVLVQRVRSLPPATSSM
jgi:hypothetical protein